MSVNDNNNSILTSIQNWSAQNSKERTSPAFRPNGRGSKQLAAALQIDTHNLGTPLVQDRKYALCRDGPSPYFVRVVKENYGESTLIQPLRPNPLDPRLLIHLEGRYFATDPLRLHSTEMRAHTAGLVLYRPDEFVQDTFKGLIHEYKCVFEYSNQISRIEDEAQQAADLASLSTGNHSKLSHEDWRILQEKISSVVEDEAEKDNFLTFIRSLPSIYRDYRSSSSSSSSVILPNLADSSSSTISSNQSSACNTMVQNSLESIPVEDKGLLSHVDKPSIAMDQVDDCYDNGAEVIVGEEEEVEDQLMVKEKENEEEEEDLIIHSQEEKEEVEMRVEGKEEDGDGLVPVGDGMRMEKTAEEEDLVIPMMAEIALSTPITVAVSSPPRVSNHKKKNNRSNKIQKKMTRTADEEKDEGKKKEDDDKKKKGMSQKRKRELDDLLLLPTVVGCRRDYLIESMIEEAATAKKATEKKKEKKKLKTDHQQQEQKQPETMKQQPQQQPQQHLPQDKKQTRNNNEQQREEETVSSARSASPSIVMQQQFYQATLEASIHDSSASKPPLHPNSSASSKMKKTTRRVDLVVALASSSSTMAALTERRAKLAAQSFSVIQKRDAFLGSWPSRKQSAQSGDWTI